MTRDWIYSLGATAADNFLMTGKELLDVLLGDHCDTDAVLSDTMILVLERILLKWLTDGTTFLEGVANTGMVELGDARLAAYLAEKKPTGQPFFRNGLPSLVAFPSGCRTSDCLVRYEGELSVDAVTDWFATAILTLPRISYYSKESLGQAFLAKSSPWKLLDSGRYKKLSLGESHSFLKNWGNGLLLSCAKLLRIIGLMLPLHLYYGKKRILQFGGIRMWIYYLSILAVCVHENYYALLLSSNVFIWLGSNMGTKANKLHPNYMGLPQWKFEVESAPAIVFLKDPGVKPVVHHVRSPEACNIHYPLLVIAVTIWMLSLHLMLVIQKDTFDLLCLVFSELPQLRSITSMELGCDARGYSRAGYDTMTWYCVILAGRLSLELNKMRETMRRVQQILSSAAELNGADKQQPSEPSAIALKDKRLTFTWLDGEAQKYLFLCSNIASSIFILRIAMILVDREGMWLMYHSYLLYVTKRNATVDDLKVERRPKGIWNPFQEEDVDPASQLVARYNGSGEIPEIIKWISQIIKDGDSRDLPLFRTKTPQLVPEDGDPIWSKGAQSILSTSKGLKYRIKSIISGMNDRLGDPRIGPMLLLGSLMSFASIWLKRSQATHQSRLDQPSQPSNMVGDGLGHLPTLDEDRKLGETAKQLCQAKIDLHPSLTWNQKMRTRRHYQIQTLISRCCLEGIDVFNLMNRI
ncbi:hypothetical protein CK203_111665 [Vitis vinifera]|uniref:Uncharacterized protein n=1 Tax=Vitis vinifera TaxID=29760 RepID=A0A438FDX5_VITVI|nr:hypothetical protein CK203_111665 [Vitis vinifera]